MFASVTSTASELTIRALCPTDLDQIFDQRSRQFGERWLERQRAGETYVAVAEFDGTPVARVGLDFTSHLPHGAAHLWAAHVEPGFQSRGIGTTLFLHIEDVARTRGFGLIRLAVGKDNQRARLLYERLGYKVCGEETSRWTYRDGDRTVEVAEECWTMEKDLASSLDKAN
jgi:ribosomal protein S18 acetylase RimI-like enzyme